MLLGGTIRSRTGLKGFAGPCMTALPWRRSRKILGPTAGESTFYSTHVTESNGSSSLSVGFFAVTVTAAANFPQRNCLLAYVVPLLLRIQPVRYFPSAGISLSTVIPAIESRVMSVSPAFALSTATMLTFLFPSAFHAPKTSLGVGTCLHPVPKFARIPPVEYEAPGYCSRYFSWSTRKSALSSSRASAGFSGEIVFDSSDAAGPHEERIAVVRIKTPRMERIWPNFAWPRSRTS